MATIKDLFPISATTLNGISISVNETNALAGALGDYPADTSYGIARANHFISCDSNKNIDSINILSASYLGASTSIISTGTIVAGNIVLDSADDTISGAVIEAPELVSPLSGNALETTSTGLTVNENNKIPTSGAVIDFVSSRLSGVVRVSATNSWVCPDDVTKIFLAISAGGGGGGDSRNGADGGRGGSGAIATGFLTVTPGTTYNITIGSGGLGGDSNDHGLSGGESKFVISGGATLAHVTGGNGGGRGGSDPSNPGDNGATGTVITALEYDPATDRGGRNAFFPYIPLTNIPNTGDSNNPGTIFEFGVGQGGQGGDASESFPLNHGSAGSNGAALIIYTSGFVDLT